MSSGNSIISENPIFFFFSGMMYLFTITKDSNDIHVECSYNETFKKWEPLTSTDKPISLSKDISF